MSPFFELPKFLHSQKVNLWRRAVRYPGIMGMAAIVLTLGTQEVVANSHVIAGQTLVEEEVPVEDEAQAYDTTALDYYVKKDYKNALDAALKLSGKEQPWAFWVLGELYRYGRGVEQNKSTALEWHLKAAELDFGVSDLSQFMVGYCYLKASCGNKKDVEKAFYWFQKASAQGNSGAQYWVGFFYAKGIAVDQDQEKAKAFYQQSAEQGNGGAQQKLALIYYQGTGVTQDYSEAFKWFLKAAENNYVLSQDYVGYMYRVGQGVEPDLVETIKWYRKAADAGHVSSQVGLGGLYYAGEGVDKNRSEAFKWYMKAAEGDDVVGQYSVAAMYQYGQGVGRNLLLAIKWYKKAAKAGYDKAQQQLDKMEMPGQYVKEQEHIENLDGGTYTEVTFSPDLQIAAFNNSGNQLLILLLRDGRSLLLDNEGKGKFGEGIAYTPNNKYLMATQGKFLIAIDRRTRKITSRLCCVIDKIHRPDRFRRLITRLAISSSGNELYTMAIQDDSYDGRGFAPDRTRSLHISTWSLVDEQRKLKEFVISEPNQPFHYDQKYSEWGRLIAYKNPKIFQLSRDGAFIVVGHSYLYHVDGNQLTVISIEDMATRHSEEIKDVIRIKDPIDYGFVESSDWSQCRSISGDGSLLLLANNNNEIRLIDTETLKVVKSSKYSTLLDGVEKISELDQFYRSSTGWGWRGGSGSPSGIFEDGKGIHQCALSYDGNIASFQIGGGAVFQWFMDTNRIRVRWEIVSINYSRLFGVNGTGDVYVTSPIIPGSDEYLASGVSITALTDDKIAAHNEELKQLLIKRIATEIADEDKEFDTSGLYQRADFMTMLRWYMEDGNPWQGDCVGGMTKMIKDGDENGGTPYAYTRAQMFVPISANCIVIYENNH